MTASAGLHIIYATDFLVRYGGCIDALMHLGLLGNKNHSLHSNWFRSKYLRGKGLDTCESRFLQGAWGEGGLIEKDCIL